jgi:hypothetical protein
MINMSQFDRDVLVLLPMICFKLSTTLENIP